MIRRPCLGPGYRMRDGLLRRCGRHDEVSELRYRKRLCVDEWERSQNTDNTRLHQERQRQRSRLSRLLRAVHEGLIEHDNLVFTGNRHRAGQRGSRGSLEQVFDRSADAFGDLAGAFHSADGYVLTRSRSTFANRSSCVDGMQRHQIGGALPSTFGSSPGASCRASRDIAGTVCDLPSGTRLRLLVPNRLLLGLSGCVLAGGRLAPA